MTETATQRALDLITRWTKVAQRDNTTAGGYGVKVSPKGRYANAEGTRIGHDQAVQIVAAALNAEALPATTAVTAQTFAWDKLNQNTKDFFFRFCELIQTQTGDYSMVVPARIGKHGISITLAECPLLTNLKRAGVLVGTTGEKATHKYVAVTELGQAIWTAHCG